MNDKAIKNDTTQFWATVDEIEKLAGRLDGLSRRITLLFEKLPTSLFNTDVLITGFAPKKEYTLVIRPSDYLENILSALRTLDLIFHPLHDPPYSRPSDERPRPVMYRCQRMNTTTTPSAILIPESALDQ